MRTGLIQSFHQPAQSSAKAAEDSHTPKPRRSNEMQESAPASWSAAVLCRFVLFYALMLATVTRAAAPVGNNITLENFRLVGDLNSKQATFTLTTTTHVENSKKGIYR